jgi:hypothetical protein
MDTKHYLNIVIFVAGICVSQLLFAEQVGQIQYIRGAAIMQDLDGANARLVAKNEAVQRGDVIKTGPSGFTIVQLIDGTGVTIRPNSSFSVEKFNPKTDLTDSAILRLFSGGLRVITGYISKKNPNAYQLRTGVASIAIQDAKFDFRLCQDDCANENNTLKKNYDKQLERTVARAVFIHGGLFAKSIDGTARTLNPGSAIFQGDTLITKPDAYSIIVFRDKSRISLQANTVFRVDEMKLDADNVKQSPALFSLLRGGLRAVTGLMNILHPEKYDIRTSIATMSARSAGYDLMCTGACEVAEEKYNTESIKLPGGDGLYAHVWNGSIEIDGQVLLAGEAGFKLDKSSSPVVLPGIPDLFKNNTVPKPGSIDVDEKFLFSTIETQKIPPGLYVSVTEGNIILKGKTGLKINLKAGQAGYADVLGRQVKKLVKTPVFQRFDAYPLPDVPNPDRVSLNVGFIGIDDGYGRVCEIK